MSPIAGWEVTEPIAFDSTEFGRHPLIESWELPDVSPWPWIRSGFWLDQGYTANPSRPTNGLNRPVIFNDRANEYLMNQFYVFSEVDLWTGDNGAHAMLRGDVSYGYDSHFITSAGLERHRDRTHKWNTETDNYGLSLPQAFVDLKSPDDWGLSLRVGHFYSIAGYESFAAPTNFFYSHSYGFSYGTPFTQTGALATYSPHANLTLYGGYSQGWDAWNSLGTDWGVVLGAEFHDTERDHLLKVVAQAGEDVTNTISQGKPISGGRQAVFVVYEHQLSPQTRYVASGVFGNQQDAVAVVNIVPRTITFDDAQWYGVCQYLIWDPGDWYSAAIRFEWFADAGHSRISTPVDFNPGGPVFTGVNYFALTGGTNIRLTPNVLLRPEIRWDWSDVRGSASVPGGDPAVRAFGDRTHGSQITFGFDVIMQF
ncbi:outer membrane beta-barrel protein [Bremerella sp. JC770]|uniref:outer membrane beta-barrel protein n=1 Tax=Bremerella sp. JC770 TaxID=3232137 RepID=UPI003458E369